MRGFYPKLDEHEGLHLGGSQKCGWNGAVLPLSLGRGEMTIVFVLPTAGHLS